MIDKEEFEKYEKAVDDVSEMFAEMEMELSTALTTLSYLYIATAKHQAEMTKEEVLRVITSNIEAAYAQENQQWLN